ncbi:glycosyltransferase [bacterium]|nr:glycosyltransferase [bacterium]
MANYPMISIVLPLYNGRPFIEETLRSVEAQTTSDAELVIVDDGSTDDGAAFAKELCQNSASSVLRSANFISKANGGVVEARNVGIAESKGKHIALLDQDDLWESDRLEKMAYALEKEKARWGYSAFYRFYADGRKILKDDGKSDGKAALTKIVEGKLFIPPAASLIERSLLTECGGFVPAFAPSDDWDLFLKLAENEKGVYVKEPLVRFRSHKTSTGKRQRDLIFMAQEEVLRLHEEKLKSLVPVSALSFRRSRIYFHLAQTYAEKKDKIKAKQYFKMALKERPFRVKCWLKYLKFLLGS